MARRPLSLASPAALSVLAMLAMALAAPRCPHTGITAVRVASGLESPVYVTAPRGDDRLFIVERTGRIRILRDGSLLSTPFLDVSSVLAPITGADEGGLVGLAFPPDYASTGFFYVTYYRMDGAMVLVRQRVSLANPDVANQSPLAYLLVVFPSSPSRDGGHIEFAPDGMLLLALGDGAQGDLAQSTSSLFGKVLRLDVSGAALAGYRIPPDNPSFGSGSRRELWDIGLGNPVRFHADPLSGLLIVSDSGASSDELDVEWLPSGGGHDYGWDRMDGDSCVDPQGCGGQLFAAPMIEAPHTSPGCPHWIAGKTYYGSIFEIWGQHFFGDACTGDIESVRFAIDRRGDPFVADRRDWTADLTPDVGSIDSVASFGLDGQGELYIVDPDGEIFQVVPRSDVGGGGGVDGGTTPL